jgi:hypothetical protein
LKYVDFTTAMALDNFSCLAIFVSAGPSEERAETSLYNYRRAVRRRTGIAGGGALGGDSASCSRRRQEWSAGCRATTRPLLLHFYRRPIKIEQCFIAIKPWW